MKPDQDNTGAKWATAFKRIPSLRAKGFGYLHFKAANQDSASWRDLAGFDWTQSFSPTHLLHPQAVMVAQLVPWPEEGCGEEGSQHSCKQAWPGGGQSDLLPDDHMASGLQLKSSMLWTVLSKTDGTDTLQRGRQGGNPGDPSSS